MKKRIFSIMMSMGMSLVLFMTGFFGTCFIKADASELSTNGITINSEYLIPDTVADAMSKGFCRVKLLSTTARWQGITYKEDKQLVIDEINGLIEEGVYPSKLWD